MIEFTNEQDVVVVLEGRPCMSKGKFFMLKNEHLIFVT